MHSNDGSALSVFGFLLCVCADGSGAGEEELKSKKQEVRIKKQGVRDVGDKGLVRAKKKRKKVRDGEYL